jgi:hypothetical protein
MYGGPLMALPLMRHGKRPISVVAANKRIIGGELKDAEDREDKEDAEERHCPGLAEFRTGFCRSRRNGCRMKIPAGSHQCAQVRASTRLEAREPARLP